LPPRPIREYDRGLDLAFRDRPVSLEEQSLLFGIHLAETVMFIKADRPGRISPGPDENWRLRQLPQVSE
jgi:hypothetical protein